MLALYTYIILQTSIMAFKVYEAVYYRYFKLPKLKVRVDACDNEEEASQLGEQ